jgi:hypothetical protein
MRVYENRRLSEVGLIKIYTLTNNDHIFSSWEGYKINNIQQYIQTSNKHTGYFSLFICNPENI